MLGLFQPHHNPAWVRFSLFVSVPTTARQGAYGSVIATHQGAFVWFIFDPPKQANRVRLFHLILAAKGAFRAVYIPAQKSAFVRFICCTRGCICLLICCTRVRLILLISAPHRVHLVLRVTAPKAVWIAYFSAPKGVFETAHFNTYNLSDF